MTMTMAMALPARLISPALSSHGKAMAAEGEVRLYQRPWFWAVIVFAALFIGNLILW